MNMSSRGIVFNVLFVFQFWKKKQLVKDVAYVNSFYMYYITAISKKFNKDKKNSVFSFLDMKVIKASI